MRLLYIVCISILHCGYALTIHSVYIHIAPWVICLLYIACIAHIALWVMSLVLVTAGNITEKSMNHLTDDTVVMLDRMMQGLQHEDLS